MRNNLSDLISRLFGHTIARRLYVSFGILVLLLVVMGVGSLVAQNTIDHEISRIVDTSFRLSTLATEIRDGVNNLRVAFGEFLVGYQQGEPYDATWAQVTPQLDNLDEVRLQIVELRTLAEASNKVHLSQLVEHLNLLDSTITQLETAVPDVATDLQTMGNSASTGLTGELFQKLEDFRRLAAGTGLIRVESTALEAFKPLLSYLVEQNDALIGEFNAIVEEFEGVVSTSAMPQTREDELIERIRTVQTAFDGIVSLRAEVDAGIESIDTLTGSMDPALAALSEVAVIELDEAIAGFERAQRAVLIFKIVVMIVGVTVGTVLALSIVRSISEPLGRLVWVTQRVGEGDLRQRAEIHTQDEFGRLGMAFDEMVSQVQTSMSNQVARERVEQVVAQYRDVISRVAQGDLTARLELEALAEQSDMSSDDLYQLGINLNLMVDNLRNMTSQIRDTASAVARAVTEIEAATTQQLATTSEQDAAITQTMATVEEVRTTVTQMANRAQQVAQSSQQSVTASKQGEEIVLDTITGMEYIQRRVNDIAETILSLSERTQQIGEIIDTVNGLAEQSKLLALNASIEAARAGEEGRGFAVVAMEVRQLAEQSREATNRVHAILNEIQQATNTAVMVTEEGSKGAVEGMSLVERAGDTIRELGNVLEEAMQAATQIAASTHQQTSGMDQLAAAMAQIQQASAQAAASADQTEQNVRNIVTMSQQLEDAASRYQL